MSGSVYRMFDQDGALLYVGATGSMPRRLQQHAGSRPWWHEVAQITVQHFDTMDEALKVELAAIIAESPRYTRPPSETTRSMWQARKVQTAQAHAAGRRCNYPPCVECRTRSAIAAHSKLHGRNLVTDVQALRSIGHGRWAVAQMIERLLASDPIVEHRGVTVGMIEWLERAEQAA